MPRPAPPPVETKPLTTAEREVHLQTLVDLGADAQKARELDHASLRACVDERVRRGDLAAKRKVETLHAKLAKERNAMAKKTAPAKTESGLLHAFYVFDKDGSGTIDREEFLTIMTAPTGKHKEHPPMLTRDQAEMLFDEIDTDGSGCVDDTEFAHAWADLDGQYVTGRLNPRRSPTRSKSRMKRGLSFFHRRSSREDRHSEEDH